MTKKNSKVERIEFNVSQGDVRLTKINNVTHVSLNRVDLGTIADLGDGHYVMITAERDRVETVCTLDAGIFALISVGY